MANGLLNNSILGNLLQRNPRLARQPQINPDMPFGGEMTVSAPQQPVMLRYPAPAIKVASNERGETPLRKRMQGLLGSIGGFFQNNPNLLDTLAIGFGGMSMNPNQALMQQAAGRISQREQLSAQQEQTNRTQQYLKSIGRPELASAIKANPEMATSILQSVIGVGSDTYATRGFDPRVDEQTGQYYGIEYNPNTGQYTRVDIPGAIGETQEQASIREREEALELSDYSQAQEAGQVAFVAAERATGTIETLYSALSALEEGAETGFIASFMPSFSASTTQLRQAATQMGIDLINSATFGALSERELQLALSSTIDTRLPYPELKKLLEDKITAQRKLRDELMKKARELSAGKVRYSDWIQRYEPAGGTQTIVNYVEQQPADVVVSEDEL